MSKIECGQLHSELCYNNNSVKLITEKITLFIGKMLSPQTLTQDYALDTTAVTVLSKPKRPTWLLFSVELLLSESDTLSTDSELLSGEILGLFGFCFAGARYDGLLVTTKSESSSDESVGTLAFAVVCLAFVFFGRD